MKLTLSGFIFFLEMVVFTFFVGCMAYRMEYATFEPFYLLSMDLMCLSNPYVVFACSRPLQKQMRRLIWGKGATPQSVSFLGPIVEEKASLLLMRSASHKRSATNGTQIDTTAV